jgi:hypothetical protein
MASKAEDWEPILVHDSRMLPLVLVLKKECTLGVGFEEGMQVGVVLVQGVSGSGGECHDDEGKGC